MTDIDDEFDDAELEPAPLGFKIVLVAAALYLVVRLIQMLAWLF